MEGEGSEQRWSICRARAGVEFDRWRWLYCCSRPDPVGSLVREGDDAVVEDSDGDDTLGAGCASGDCRTDNKALQQQPPLTTNTCDCITQTTTSGHLPATLLHHKLV